MFFVCLLFFLNVVLIKGFETKSFYFDYSWTAHWRSRRATVPDYKTLPERSPFRLATGTARQRDWRVSHYSLRVPDKMPIGLRPPCLPGSTEFIRITENSSTLIYIISASISATCLTGVREAGGKGNVLRGGGRESRGTASAALLPEWLVTRLASNSIGLYVDVGCCFFVAVSTLKKTVSFVVLDVRFWGCQ